MPTKLDRHVEQLAALASAPRLTILRAIIQGSEDGTAVGELQERLDIPWSTLSHHLDRLKTAGLVIERSEGKFNYHRADIRALRALTDYLWEDCCKGGKAHKSCC